MKKVCHITSAHNSNDMRIFQKECTSLASADYEVYLVAPGDSQYKNKVHIVGIGDKPNSRLLRMTKFAKKAYEKAISIDADIYHIHDPELLLYALRFVRKGKKVIFDSHEDVPGQILGKAWIPSPIRKIVAKYYTEYEKRILSKLDAVVSVTPHLTERLVRVNKKTVEITNYPRIQENESDGKKDYSKRSRAICFAGGISSQWMHETIIKAVARIEDVQYNLCGPSSEDYLKHLRSLKGWNKVEYFGKVSHNKVQDIYNQSMIGLAIANYSNNVKGNVGTLGNTKLFEIMLTGLPVICTDFILWRQIVDEYQCGLYVQPDDIDEIALAIRYLFDNPDIARQMGENGRRAVLEKFNWNVEERKLLKLYEEILA